MLFFIYFRFQAAIFDFSLIRTSSCTNVRPMLFNAKDMRIPMKSHIYSICNLRFKCFRLHVRHFYFRLNLDRNVHRAMLLSTAMTSASSKTNAVTLNFVIKVIYALRLNGHQVYHIFTKKSSTFIAGDIIR